MNGNFQLVDLKLDSRKRQNFSSELLGQKFLQKILSLLEMNFRIRINQIVSISKFLKNFTLDLFRFFQALKIDYDKKIPYKFFPQFFFQNLKDSNMKNNHYIYKKLPLILPWKTHIHTMVFCELILFSF